MRNPKRICIVVISLLLFVGCGHFSKETDSFNEALEVYGMTIPGEEHCFVVIPVYSCLGCVQKTWLWLRENVSKEPNSHITVIDCNKENVFAKQVKCDVHFDTLRVLDKVCFDLANPTIIKTVDKKITSIISIDSRYIDETLELELKDFLPNTSK